MAKRELPTAEYVRQILDYNPETGVFRWKTRTPDMFGCRGRPAQTNCNAWNSRYSGMIAGHLAQDGYVHIAINNRLYKAHRLAWLFITGEWPRGEIDHANMNPCDNRAMNLRVANKAQNRMNQRVSKSSKTGIKGVRFVSASGRFEARITLNRKTIYLGSFSNSDAAAAAYWSAAQLYFGEFARMV